MARIQVIAHAGGAGLGPENTLAAIRSSIDCGVDGVEVDVRATADGVPVLLHDETVDRTTDGSGRIDSMTAEAAGRLDASRAWRGPDAGYEPLPDLASTLREVGGRATLHLEVKVAGIEAAVLGEVGRAGALSWVELHSFLPEVLYAVRGAEPGSATTLVVSDLGGDLVETARSVGASALSLGYELVLRYPELMERARRAGLRAYVWTVDDPKIARKLATLGADAVITNRPDLMRR